MLGRTREEIEENLKEWAAWLAAGITGVGVALLLTIIFVNWGSRLILLGGLAGAAGWGVARIMPACLRYHSIACPSCHTVNQVVMTAVEFNCSGCGRKLRGQGFWQNGSKDRRHRQMAGEKKITYLYEKQKQHQQEKDIS